MQTHDQQIVDALLSKDEKVTHEFFFVRCRPLFCSLIRRIFDYEVDYDEMVNELYIHLMSDDGRRLRTFQGRSSVYQWLKCVATRVFLEKRDGGMVIEDVSSEPPCISDAHETESMEMDWVRQDVRKMLSLMRNPRYRLVMQRLLDGYDYESIAEELRTSVPNLYNIKKRAMTEFTAIVLKEYGHE
ncbi:MAG: RNA polymerase sigma factor [Candidatus Cryptobacteroides sp.]